MSEQVRPKAPKSAAPKPAPEGERIAKVLSRAGVASRREAERMIEAGEIKVNGKVITSPALNVTAKDRITVRGEPLAAKQPARLWLYYKPEGLVTSASDEKGRDTVFDHLPEELPRVMSIGRLDLNSEGLLLLTNDGGLKRQLELPSTGWLRKYRVRIHGNPTDADFEPLRKGIEVEGERFQPMQVSLDRVQGANAWATVGLREGKNREIRRAMSAIGLTVNRLIRVSYGPFRLNDLQPGEVAEIKGRILREQLGFDPDGGEDLELPEKPRGKPAPKRGTTAKPAIRSAPAKPGKPGGRLARSAEEWLDAAEVRAIRAGKPAAGKTASARPASGKPRPSGADSGPRKTGGAPRPARDGAPPAGKPRPPRGKG